jgi:hypothetical protein
MKRAKKCRRCIEEAVAVCMLGRYEIKIAGHWYPVNGSTDGLEAGWLQWTDGEADGLASPGTWRCRDDSAAIPPASTS